MSQEAKSKKPTALTLGAILELISRSSLAKSGLTQVGGRAYIHGPSASGTPLAEPRK